MKYSLGLLAASLVALLSTAAFADRSDTNSDRCGARTSITVTIDALTCTTTAGASSFNANAWSWGANNTATSGSGAGGSGREALADLSVTKALDACSPALFRAVATGLHFRTLTLRQQDARGNVLARVV